MQSAGRESSCLDWGFGWEAGENRSKLDFRILGSLEVSDTAGPLTLPGGRAPALLALLVIHPGEVVSTDRLIDELWGPTSPPTALTKLYGLISSLRRHIAPNRTPVAASLLQTRAPGYLLAVEPEEVDAGRFRRLVKESSGAPAPQRAETLRQALDLWRGPALADFTYESFAQTEIRVLEELRLAATEGRVDADLALGRHHEVVSELESLVAEHPFRERLRGQLMLALYRSGRQADALGAYRHARSTLAEELGLDPGPELQELEGAILRQEPSLALRPVRPQPGPLPAGDVGTGTAAEPLLVESRKPVTVMFVELVVSPTSDPHLSDPESVRLILGRGYQTVRQVISRHGGTVEGLIGNVAVAVFGVPTAHEDDVVRAVRAALELPAALMAGGAEGIVCRTGINTGEVVVGDPMLGATAASGGASVVAGRLRGVASDGEVLVGESTRRLLGSTVVVEPVARRIGGVEPALTGWRVLGMVPKGGTPRPPLGAPMLGRDAELARLLGAFQTAVTGDAATMVVVVGEPGVGKTRLTEEFSRALRGEAATVLTGHCLSSGEGVTFWPLREIVLQAGGGGDEDALIRSLVSDDDAEFVAEQPAGAAGSTAAPARPEAVFPAVRRLFESWARERPLVVVVEDVHWAQPTLIDLLEYLAGAIEGPVLLVCLARPEFLEQRPAWGDGSEGFDLLLLQPLSADQAEQLIADRSFDTALPSETVRRIAETAQGNPLFLEQMVAAVRNQEDVSIPPTVQALLVARLDMLGPAERELIRVASVLGTDFERSALSALLPEEARRSSGRHLEALERRELLVATRRTTGGGEGFRFRHVLVRLAAYGTITKEARARLHERVADWLEAEAEAGTMEIEELVGYHLEQAYEYRRQLGMVDEHGRGLALRAGERLGSAGRRAFARFDAAAAENLLSRARALLPTGNPQLWEVRRQLAEAYQVMGRHHEADAVLSELLEAAGSDNRLEHRLLLEQARVRLATGPDPIRLDALRAEALRAQAVFERAGDESGLAQAHFVLGEICLRLGRPTDMESLARRGLVHADRSGSAREQLGARRMVATALEVGPTPVQDCLRECEELSRWRGMENPGVQPVLAYLRSMVGEFDEARELLARARRMLTETTRARRPLVLLARWEAEVDILAGDLASAERHLRAAIELGLDMGIQDVSEPAAILSRILLAQGDTNEAARLAGVSRSHAPSESVAAQALCRSAAALLLASHGSDEEGERLARQAVEMVPPEMVNLSAGLRLDLASVVAMAGRPDDASLLTRDAVARYERKGNLAAAARASGDDFSASTAPIR